MGPSERRDVPQKFVRVIESGAFSCRHCLPEVFGVPVDDDGRQQVQPGHAEVLSFDGPITDFALAATAQSVFQGVMGLALVETDLDTALHVGIEQPVDDEERALDATDFT